MFSFKVIDLEKLLRYPQKGDPLVPSPTPLERYGGNPADAYARGYRMAADILAAHIRQRGDETFLFYPLVFLYRHHVELMLKNLILAFDEPGVRWVTQAELLSEEDRESLAKGKKAHSLQELWERLRPVVLALGHDVVSAERIEGIDFYVQQLNEIDPHPATNFRYPEKIDETKAKLRELGNDGDIKEFAEAMERLANYLDGLDSYVGTIIDHYHEMLADSYDPSY